MRLLLVIACVGLVGVLSPPAAPGAEAAMPAASIAPVLSPEATRAQARAAIDRLIALEAARGPIHGEGVVTEIQDHSITVSYDPIASDEHGASTMRFDADPALLNGIAVGDHVDFELQRADQPLTISKINKTA